MFSISLRFENRKFYFDLIFRVVCFSYFKLILELSVVGKLYGTHDKMCVKSKKKSFKSRV